jgi:S1-C subfamily serine protease
MRIVTALAIVAGLFGLAAVPAAQTPDERVAAREFVKKSGDAVVMVLATLKIRANVGGEEQTVDQQAQANGTILDPGGLAVLSLSTLEPDEMMARSLSARTRPGTRVDVSSAPSGIRMHLADGREIPSKLVLRDVDLDLAFIKPVEPLASPLTSISAPAAKASLMDLLFVIQRTSEATGWSTAATFGSVQVVLDKPRPYYQLAMNGNGSQALGSPVFDPAGHFVGLVVMRTSGARGPNATGVLPAADILEVAKQARE